MVGRHALWTAAIISCGICLASCGGRQSPSAPVATSAPSPAKNEMYIVIQRGQTLDAVADRFHITKADIIALNDLKPPYRLKPGGVLKLPVTAQLHQETEADEGSASLPKPSSTATAVTTPAPPAQAQRPARPKAAEKPKPPKVIPLD
jgi:LysM repeat protein